MTRVPVREVVFLVVALGLLLVWSISVNTTKAVPLGLLAVAALGIHAWLRWSANRKLPTAPDADFLRSCQVPPAHEATALRLRASVASAFGLSPDRVSGGLQFGELMALTGWFGSDLLALSEVQEEVDALAPGAGEVRPDRTVCDVVRSIVR